MLLQSTGKYSNVLECTGMYWNVLECTHLDESSRYTDAKAQHHQASHH